MIRAASLDETLEAAKRACPPDCVLVLEILQLRSSVACAASYKRTNEFGSYSVFYATGASEAEALTKLVRQAMGMAA